MAARKKKEQLTSMQMRLDELLNNTSPENLSEDQVEDDTPSEFDRSGNEAEVTA